MTDNVASNFHTDGIARFAPDWMQDTRGSLLIITSDTEGSWEGAALTENARCLGRVSPEQALERLTNLVDVDVIVLDCSNTEMDMSPVATRLEAFAREHQTALIIDTTLACLDRHLQSLEQCAWSDGPVQWLCDPTPAERQAALRIAFESNRTSATLHDSSREQHGAKLEQLSHEVQRLSHMLESMRHGQAHAFGNAGDHTAPPAGERSPSTRKGGDWTVPMTSDTPIGSGERVLTVGIVQDILRARRLREQFFGEELFADPAWDMILDLMAARLSGARVSVSSLCIASSVPPTTALRWIRHLTQSGIFERRPDTQDGRRVFIALSDKTAAAVHRWFSVSVAACCED